MNRRTFLVGFFLATLVIAGFGSYYASSHPDGLQYVAEQAGFAEAADQSPVSGGPFADYSTRGVDDPRLSGGLAGVVGSGVVLLIGGALFWTLRRRTPARPEA